METLSFLQRRDLTRWNHVSLGLGGWAWGMIVLASLLGWLALDDLEIVLLLALFVITPLVVPLVLRQKEGWFVSRLSPLVLLLQPFAAIVGSCSFFVETGPLAAMFAAGWLVFTGLLALIGLVQLYQMFCQRSTSLPDLCLAVALLYLPVGGAWMLLARWGLQPLGFGVHTDLLTATHFHFIALAALVITGLTGKAMQHIEAKHCRISWIVYRVAALGVLIDPLLVAAGLTTAQITGLHFLDTAPADLLALSLILLALSGLRFVVPRTTSRFAQVLLVLSYTTVFFTMLFAGAYALGVATETWTITIPQMVAIHGLENALVFGFCGLLGWRIRARQGKTGDEPCV